MSPLAKLRVFTLTSALFFSLATVTQSAFAESFNLSQQEHAADVRLS